MSTYCSKHAGAYNKLIIKKKILCIKLVKLLRSKKPHFCRSYLHSASIKMEAALSDSATAICIAVTNIFFQIEYTSIHNSMHGNCKIFTIDVLTEFKSLLKC